MIFSDDVKIKKVADARFDESTCNTWQIFMSGELWGKVVEDNYFNCYRHSDDRYFFRFNSLNDAITDLIESVTYNLNNS